MNPDERFCADIPAHLQEDVMTMIAESAQYDAGHDCVTILERDRLDSINVKAHGIIEVDGEEYTFIVRDGNWDGTVLEAWNEDKTFEPFHRIQWSLQPRRDIIARAIVEGRGLFLIAKWDALLSKPDVSEIVGKYTYDRMMQPGNLIEGHYREKAAAAGFEIVSKETADETRVRLSEATKPLEIKQ